VRRLFVEGALGAGYASTRGASDEKRAVSEYKADGGGIR
jgi:hypothetical protein